MILALLLLSCTDYGYTQLTMKDSFQQVRRNTVDILLVVDDSCSMVEEQDKLARNFDGFLAAFEDADVDWQLGVITTDVADEAAAGRLVGGGDELELRSPDGRLLDRLAWTVDWPASPGASLQLDPGVVRPTDADAVASWCLSTATYGVEDRGTPGAANAACGSAGPPPDTGAGDTGAGDTGAGDTGAGDTGGGDSGGGGADSGGGEDSGAGEASVSVGEVLITELLVDGVDHPDAQGEWVELTSFADRDLDLSGFTLGDDGGQVATLPDGSVLPAGGHLVVGRSALPHVDVVVDDGLRLADPLRRLTPAEPDAAETFAELVAVGTGGAGIEMGLEAARLALADPEIAAENGLLREEANLALIFLTDEDDQSADATQTYLRDLGTLKGDAAFRTPGVLTISAVAGVQPPAYAGALSCESDDGAAEYAARYVTLAAETAGAAESICDADFSPIAYQLGLAASGLSTTFVLSKPAASETVIVKLYADQAEDSLIAELVRDVDYRFDEPANAVVFAPAQAPPSESWVVVEYELLATGQGVQ